VKQEILTNEKIAPNIFRAGIAVWEEGKSSSPGQFLHIRCSSTFTPLLRRPLSIHEVNSNEISILYKVVGIGTELLSKKDPGEELDIIGPLGKGFSLNPVAGSVVIVAGGMGIAPTFFLARSLKASKKQVLIGARTAGLVLCEEILKEAGCAVSVATDDGSYGEKGQVSTLFRKFMNGEKPDIVYACGPAALLKEVAGACADYGVPCEVSLEGYMACGVGACLGCAVKMKGENGSLVYKRVCRDGPVFDANMVLWEDLGL